jgi:hypothetical protein
MTTENIYDGITHVVQLSTHIGSSCEHCNFSVGCDNFVESINHYITQHGYKLLHIGTQTGEGLQMTVALLGK